MPCSTHLLNWLLGPLFACAVTTSSLPFEAGEFCIVIFKSQHLSLIFFHLSDQSNDLSGADDRAFFPIFPDIALL
jgi:hypothetical protein